MNEPIIDRRYAAAYRIAHEERAQAFRNAVRWIFNRDRSAQHDGS